MLSIGIAWGFLESFLFWFLQNLGGSGLLLGLTTSVSGLCGLPFLILNQPIINRFGHVNTIALGLIFYGIRLVGMIHYVLTSSYLFKLHTVPCVFTLIHHILMFALTDPLLSRLFTGT